MTANERATYGELRTRIMSGRYKPGDLMIPAAVGAELGVSRTPIREALMRLEIEGLVSKVSRGFVVRERSPEEILAICEARIALEAVAARSAAHRHTDFDLAHLRQLLDASRQGTPEERFRLHVQWHVALRQAARNPTVVELMDLLDARLHVYDGSDSRSADNLDLNDAEHEEIYRAVADRDPNRAEALMAAHQARTRDLRTAQMAAANN